MIAKKENITFRLDPRLREILGTIAKVERRSLSNQLNMAIEEWLQIKNELHPQFLRNIKESLQSGKPEPVWKG